MGFKAAFIMTGDCEHGYLGSLPEHQPDKCDDVLEKLGYSNCSKVETQELERGFYPETGNISLGVYEKAVCVGDVELVPKYFEEGDNALLSKAMSLFPSGKLLIVFLQSTVGFFGYSYFEKGKLVRSLVGDPDGVAVDEGVIQEEEEEEIFQKSYMKDGVRYWKWVDKHTGFSREETIVSYGEDLACCMMKKFLRFSYDEILEESDDPTQNLVMDLYKNDDINPQTFDYLGAQSEPKPKKKGFWEKLFG